MVRARTGGGVRGVLALSLAIAPSCSFPPPQDVPDPGGGDGGTDSTPPEVTATMPAPHAASVASTTSIAVTFSEPIDARSATFVVTAVDANVAGTVVAAGATLTFRPSAPLPGGTPLEVTVSGVSDAAGNPLAAPYAFDFTTTTTLCVKEGGGGGCFALPSEAVAAASAGGSIAVAAGSYVDNVSVTKAINLLGGFDAAFTARDPAAHETTLRPRAPAGDSRAIVDVTGGALLLDGFTLTGGDSGGEHGGAIRISGGAPKIRHSVVAGNTASFLGGGIYITGGVSALLIGNRIENNTVGGQDDCSGGGIAVENSTVTLRDNAITGNRVLNDRGQGGGIVLYNSVATLANNRIESNHTGGSALVGNGGGIASSQSQIAITGGTISHNDVGDTTGAGAALYANMGTVRLDAVRIEDNSAGATGGASGVHAVGANVVLASTVIAANRRGAGGVAAGPNGATVIINCTIANNEVRGITASSALTVVNSAIVGHPVGIALTGATPPPVLVRRNALFGNPTDVTGFQLDGSNLTVDPRLDATLHLAADSPLIDAAQPGNIQPADGAAMPVEPPTQDIDGDPRVLNGKGTLAPDIGADEFRP